MVSTDMTTQIAGEASTSATTQQLCWQGCGALHDALFGSTGLCIPCARHCEETVRRFNTGLDGLSLVSLVSVGHASVGRIDSAAVSTRVSFNYL